LDGDRSECKLEVDCRKELGFMRKLSFHHGDFNPHADMQILPVNYKTVFSN